MKQVHACRHMSLSSSHTLSPNQETFVSGKKGQMESLGPSAPLSAAPISSMQSENMSQRQASQIRQRSNSAGVLPYVLLLHSAYCCSNKRQHMAHVFSSTTGRLPLTTALGCSGRVSMLFRMQQGCSSKQSAAGGHQHRKHNTAARQHISRCPRSRAGHHRVFWGMLLSMIAAGRR